MRRRLRRAAPAIGICLIAVAITLIGGAARGSASTTGACTPEESSRQFCVTVTDTDGVSVSGVDIPGTDDQTLSYLAYTITVENTGLSGTLTNGVTTVQLTDSDGKASAAVFQGSPLSAAFCASKPNNVVTCSFGNLPAEDANDSVTFTVAYISSTTEGTTATDADILTSFKEMQKGEPKGANVATRLVEESTRYESGDSAGSWSPTGNEVRLATDSADTQWSVLKFSNLLKPPFVASLVETDEDELDPTDHCAPGLSCIGENVHVELNCANLDTCAISEDNFGYVRIVITNPPPGINANTVNFSHILADGISFELITERCTSNPPTSEQVPCLIPTMSRMPGPGGVQVLTADVYFNQNGDIRGY